MSEITKVALDAMGGDNAPKAIIQGAIDVVAKRQDIHILLVGQENVIRRGIGEIREYPKEQISIINATEVIETEEPPVNGNSEKERFFDCGCDESCQERGSRCFCFRRKFGSNSCRRTGFSRTYQRRWNAASLAPLIPTQKGVSLLIDCGANVDARPSHLVQFAKMGSIYMKNVIGIENPRVAIVNIGAEEEKGNALVKETFPLLKACEDINFIGSIEARESLTGKRMLLSAKAFVGNVILKLL